VYGGTKRGERETDTASKKSVSCTHLQWQIPSDIGDDELFGIDDSTEGSILFGHGFIL
jgi:hypothetical protein